MCNQFTLHRKFRIDTGRTKLGQGKTDNILHGCESHGQGTQRSVQACLDPTTSCNKQKTWKRHQDTVYWVDKQLAQQEGLKFYQTRSNAIILLDTLPAYCIPKVVVMETGEVIFREGVCVNSASSKDFWVKELDSEVAGSSEDSQRIQPKTKNPIIKNGETRG